VGSLIADAMDEIAKEEIREDLTRAARWLETLASHLGRHGEISTPLEQIVALLYKVVNTLDQPGQHTVPKNDLPAAAPPASGLDEAKELLSRLMGQEQNFPRGSQPYNEIERALNRISSGDWVDVPTHLRKMLSDDGGYFAVQARDDLRRAIELLEGELAKRPLAEPVDDIILLADELSIRDLKPTLMDFRVHPENVGHLENALTLVQEKLASGASEGDREDLRKVSEWIMVTLARTRTDLKRQAADTGLKVKRLPDGSYRVLVDDVELREALREVGKINQDSGLADWLRNPILEDGKLSSKYRVWGHFGTSSSVLDRAADKLQAGAKLTFSPKSPPPANLFPGWRYTIHFETVLIALMVALPVALNLMSNPGPLSAADVLRCAFQRALPGWALSAVLLPILHRWFPAHYSWAQISELFMPFAGISAAFISRSLGILTLGVVFFPQTPAGWILGAAAGILWGLHASFRLHQKYKGADPNQTLVAQAA